MSYGVRSLMWLGSVLFLTAVYGIASAVALWLPMEEPWLFIGILGLGYLAGLSGLKKPRS